VRKKVVWKWK